MKLLLTFILSNLLLCALSTAAQQDGYGLDISPEEETYIRAQLKESLWGNGTELYRSPVPEQFAGEHAVYLEKSIRREFYRNARSALRTSNLERNVILVQDAQGVLDHSLFTYQHIDHDHTFDITALKVIKPDGRQIVHDLEQNNKGVPTGEKGLYRYAIPGLEPGDIIDFYYYIEFRVLFPQEYSRIFDAVYWLAGEAYPVLHYNLSFTLGPSAFMNIVTDGMPPPVEASIKVDKKTFNAYSYSLFDVPAQPRHLSLYYPFRELPSMKYQVFVGPYLGNSDIRYNLGGSLKLNDALQPSRLQDYLAFVLSPGRDYKMRYKAFSRYLKSAGFKPGKCAPDSLVRHFHAYANCQYELSQLMGESEGMGDLLFPSYAHFVLEKAGIQHDVVLAVDRSVSDPANYLLADELHLLVRVTEDDTLFQSAPAARLGPGEVPSRFEGIAALTYTPASRRLDSTAIPASPGSSNLREEVIRIDLRTMEEANVTAGGLAYGQERILAEPVFQNIAAEYLREGSERHSSMERQYPGVKQRERLTGRLHAAAETRWSEIRKSRMDWFESATASDLSDYTLSSKSLQHPDRGRSLSWKESFLLKNWLDRAGQDHILDLSGIAALPDWGVRDLEGRTRNIYFDHLHTRAVTITVSAPEGYALVIGDTAQSLLTNVAGTQRTRYEMAGNEVTIYSEYSIDRLFLPAEDSPSVKELIGAFTRALSTRILLRKIEP